MHSCVFNLIGPSAAQNFQGEDHNYHNRTDAQRLQMKQWVQEQLAEKAYLNSIKKQDNSNFTVVQKKLEEIQLQCELEESDMRRMINLNVKKNNDELSKIQRENKAKMIRPYSAVAREEIWSATSLNILTETPEDACDSSGRVLRREMFKGYTESQKKRIWLENEVCRQQKLEVFRRELNDENDFVKQQSALNKVMERAAHEDRIMRQELNKEQTQFLTNQARDQRAMKDISNKNRFGVIESGFFENFGKSCR